jgi:hypothetical protein
MKHLGLLLLLFTLIGIAVTPASAADWRWAKPHLKKQTVTYHCASLKCIYKAYRTAVHRYKQRVARYNENRRQEWNHWAHLYIPTCTWYGESGTGPEFAPVRYVTPNEGGSGAYGKYQMMPGTYHSRAKYHDWSPLDQEIAGHREYAANGTGPWTNCH